MARHAPLAVLAVLALPACAPDPVDGGPCTYDSVVAEAVVAAVDTLGPAHLRVALEIATPAAGVGDGHREWVEVPPSDTGIAVGDRVPVSVDVLTEGACTPVIVTRVGD